MGNREVARVEPLLWRCLARWPLGNRVIDRIVFSVVLVAVVCFVPVKGTLVSLLGVPNPVSFLFYILRTARSCHVALERGCSWLACDLRPALSILRRLLLPSPPRPLFRGLTLLTLSVLSRTPMMLSSRLTFRHWFGPSYHDCVPYPHYSLVRRYLHSRPLGARTFLRNLLRVDRSLFRR